VDQPSGEGARLDRRRRAAGDHAPIDGAPAGEARTQARAVFDSVRGLAAAAAARLTAALSCWRRGWANSPNLPRKSRAFSKCARTGNCPAQAFSKRNLTSARSRTRRRRSGWSKRWFDAARLLPRLRKTPQWATSMPHLRRDGHDAPDRIARDGRARVGVRERLRRGAEARSSAAVGVAGVRPGRVGVARDQAVLEAVRIDAAIVGPGLSEGTGRRGEEDRERRRSNGFDGHVSSPLSRARTIASLNAKWGQPRETVASRCCQCCQIALADYHVGVRRTSPINTSSSRSRDPRSFGRHGRSAHPLFAIPEQSLRLCDDYPWAPRDYVRATWRRSMKLRLPTKTTGDDQPGAVRRHLRNVSPRPRRSSDPLLEATDVTLPGESTLVRRILDDRTAATSAPSGRGAAPPPPLSITMREVAFSRRRAGARMIGAWQETLPGERGRTWARHLLP
jgi:hypothetical protein